MSVIIGATLKAFAGGDLRDLEEVAEEIGRSGVEVELVDQEDIAVASRWTQFLILALALFAIVALSIRIVTVRDAIEVVPDELAITGEISPHH